MGNNQHLKRHAMPTLWPAERKNEKFITKPNPGSHKTKYVVPVVVLLRDVLKHAKTAKEVKLIIHTGDVLINGKKASDIKAPVGIFDVFEIKKTAEKYVLLFNEFGKVKLSNVKDDLLFLKVTSKTVLPANKLQLNFMNGFNLIVDEKTFAQTKVNDTVVFDFVKKKVVSTYALKEGSFVYIFDGKFQGSAGKIVSFDEYNGLTRDVAHIEIEGHTHSTAKDYCFAIGNKKDDLKRFA